MLQTISEADIEFCELFHDSLCIAESLFTNYNNLTVLEEGQLGHIRLGQIPLLSQEYLIDYNPKLDEKENFSLLIGAGTLYTLGGRNYGKTLTEKLDVITSMLLHDGWPMGITSYDAVHIRNIVEPILDCFDMHPILQHFLERRLKNPTYLIVSTNGATLQSVNMNITAKNPGSQFFGHHFKKLFLEEMSYETEEVYSKRVDARHETGCIERGSGMTNFTKHSPAGKIFHDQSLKSVVLNLPQYINPFWDEKEKKKAIKKFGGEGSIGYRTFVKGEVVEEGLSVLDMARIRPFYVERLLKTFEIQKLQYPYYTQILLLERPRNVDQCYVCFDVGESAPTEIAILFKVNEVFKYYYNITLQNLTDSEQFNVISFIVKRLEANVIALDCSDGTGRAIFRRLEEIFPKENLVWVAFNEKIAVEFAKDEDGSIIYKGGDPTYIEEYVSEWSVKHLRDILYEQKIEIPENAYKLDTQLNSVRVFQSGQRICYELSSEEDHVWQAFQVFSIAHWANEKNLLKSVKNKIFAKGII